MTRQAIAVRNLSLTADKPILTDVSIELEQGRVLGVVGESGSGKTLLVKSILGVLPSTVRRTSGTIELFGEDSGAFDTRKWRSLWASRFGAVFQDPGSYLNPSYTVLQHFDEFYRVALKLPRDEAILLPIEISPARPSQQHLCCVIVEAPWMRRP